MTDMMARERLLGSQDRVGPFEGYRSTMDGYVKMTPHSQGIADKDSFASIIGSLDTLLAVDEGIVVPGLYDISSAGWYNAEHIRSVTGANDIKVMHASPNLGTMEFTEEAKLAGSDFLRCGGLVVVSFPNEDGFAHENANKKLDELVTPFGERLEYVELGTQTYFEGEAMLKNGSQWKSERRKLRAQYKSNPADMIAGAFHNQAPVDARGGIRVQSYAKVPKDLTGKIYEFVGAAFQKISDHPCRQAWTDSEFQEIVEENSSVVKIVSAKDQKAAALLAFGVDLADFPWVNSDYWSDTERRSGKNVYFPTAASNPRTVGVLALSQSIGYMSEVFAAAGPGVKIYFDSCDKNRVSLPRKIEAAVGASGIHTLEFDEIAQQNYGAFRLAK